MIVASSANAESAHAIAMHGAPRHAATFSYWPYVNPSAPKSGRLRLGVVGSFDSLNPLIYKGEAASGVREYVYESLMARSADEPFTLYGHIAATVDVPDDRRSITFQLRAEARFADGKSITADDVIFSHGLLRERGWPFMRSAYAKVGRVEKLGPLQVRFDFKPDGDRELPLLLGLMPIVPKHAIDVTKFEETTLIPPVGSGPYIVQSLEPGRSVVFKRNPSWWAAGLPTAKGRYNFAEIRIEYFRDANAQFEAFKVGDLDLLVDDDPNRWSRGYDFPALKDGRIVKRDIATSTPAGMSALVFNTRKPMFADQRVRRALNLLFDAEWTNANLFAGLLSRTQSYFERSYLSSIAHPASVRERELLGPHATAVSPEIMAGSARQPASSGNGNNRANQREALNILEAAGYRVKNGRMTSDATGQQLAFEVLINSRRQERVILSFSKSLAAIGITLNLRQVDSAQYEQRLKIRDYDIIQTHWQSSLSPGNEQFNRWGSMAADAENTRNYAGIKSKAVDAMIDAIVAARAADEFTSAVRALDRILLSGDYVIPLFFAPKLWVTHRATLQRPEVSGANTISGLDLDTWWSNEK
ncbi:MAG: ABC transporter substrate-binding protein [Hyphomicrobiaceae bacterium]|nr:ABC transporter substrate-binding protein [Hyphomicrobiaceae bacterium]